jgi:serine/threonine-protein kinase
VPAPGQVIASKYRLERHLGSGGFASVWAASIVELDRKVALKVLSDTFAHNHEMVERFIREARLAARAFHPAIVRVEDIGRTDDGVPFLVMELLEGCSLMEELGRRRCLPLDEVIAIGRGLLGGLAAAHALGIVHRDVKPGNIFLVGWGKPGAQVKVLDLGLAKDLGSDEALTRTGVVMGTPDYLAPELLLGDGRRGVTPAADVFAAGVVLYKALAGRHPLEGHVEADSSPSGFVRRAMFYRDLAGAVRWADDVPGAPPALTAVLHRALAVDAAHRYRDAGQMLRALEAAVAQAGAAGLEPRQPPLDTPASGHPEDSTPTAAWDTAGSMPNARRIWWRPAVVIVVVLALVVAGGIVLGVVSWSRGPAEGARPPSQPTAPTPVAREAVESQPEARPAAEQAPAEGPGAPTADAAPSISGAPLDQGDPGVRARSPQRRIQQRRTGAKTRTIRGRRGTEFIVE